MLACFAQRSPHLLNYQSGIYKECLEGGIMGYRSHVSGFFGQCFTALLSLSCGLSAYGWVFAEGNRSLTCSHWETPWAPGPPSPTKSRAILVEMLAVVRFERRDHLSVPSWVLYQHVNQTTQYYTDHIFLEFRIYEYICIISNSFFMKSTVEAVKSQIRQV